MVRELVNIEFGLNEIESDNIELVCPIGRLTRPPAHSLNTTHNFSWLKTNRVT